MIYQKSRMKSKQEVLQSKPPSLCLQTLMVGLCVLALSIYSVQTTTCSASMSSSSATITETHTFDLHVSRLNFNFIFNSILRKFTGSSSVEIFKVVVGPVSNSLYYLDQIQPEKKRVI